MFVALSRFTIANDKATQVREAFASRPHLVDKAAGFVGMQVMSPVDKPSEFWLVTASRVPTFPSGSGSSRSSRRR